MLSTLRRAARPARRCLALHQQQAANSSFIKNVLDQVKKDMEKSGKDEKVQKAYTDLDSQRNAMKVDEAAARLRERAKAQEEKLRSQAAALDEQREGFMAKYRELSEKASSTLGDAMANENMKPVAEAGAKVGEGVSRVTSTVFGTVVDGTKKMASFFDDKDKAKKFWDEEAQRANAPPAEEANGTAAGQPEPEQAPQRPSAAPESGLVLHHETVWDRFGARVRDMPFLNNVYDNPLFDRMFGETEIAASVREMKMVDATFRMAQFTEDVEDIVAPHLIKMYLEGNSEVLKVHCGDAAYAAVSASIDERKKARVTMDPHLLDGPREVELRGATLQDNSTPLFIFTFQTQQINCLRNHEGMVIEGDIDDIRTVHWLCAITAHPEPETPGLLHPWQVSEFAIISNSSSW